MTESRQLIRRPIVLAALCAGALMPACVTAQESNSLMSFEATYGRSYGQGGGARQNRDGPALDALVSSRPRRPGMHLVFGIGGGVRHSTALWLSFRRAGASHGTSTATTTGSAQSESGWASIDGRSPTVLSSGIGADRDRLRERASSDGQTHRNVVVVTHVGLTSEGSGKREAGSGREGVSSRAQLGSASFLVEDLGSRFPVPAVPLPASRFPTS